jgi:hypothetical protein
MLRVATPPRRRGLQRLLVLFPRFRSSPSLLLWTWDFHVKATERAVIRCQKGKGQEKQQTSKRRERDMLCVWQEQTREPGRNQAKSAGKGKKGRRQGRRGPRGSRSPGRHLGGPGPNTGLGQASPRRIAARAGSQLHLGSRQRLKTKWRGLQSGSKALRSSEGGPSPCTGTFYKAYGYKKKKKKLL